MAQPSVELLGVERVARRKSSLRDEEVNGNGEYGKQALLVLDAEIIVSPLLLMTQERVLGNEVSLMSFSRKPGVVVEGRWVCSLHHLLHPPVGVLGNMTPNNYTKVLCSREGSAASYISLGL